MIAPIVFHLFLNSIGNVVLNDNNLTTIVFNEKVERVHTGATAHELYLRTSPNGKMIFIKSKGKDLNTNLSVPTISGKLYMFNIRRGSNPHSLIQVYDGQLDNSYKEVFTKNKVEIQEGNHTLKIFNKGKKPVKINYQTLSPSGVLTLPKGPTVYVNDKRFYK